jgi:phosphatidylglycerophosphate synthase
MYKEESYTSIYQAISRKFPSKEQKDNSFFYQIIMLYLKSLKPFYVEELLVFFIYRPISFLFAFLLYRLPVSPNVITVLRCICGIIAGLLFAQGTPDSIILGAIVLFISNIFDCADGQLARMRESSSWIGTTIDGIADFTTTFFVYLGVILAFSNIMSDAWLWWIFGSIGALSLVIHINTFGLLRYEFIHYTIEKYPEDLRTMKEQKQMLNSARKEKSGFFQTLFLMLNYIQIIPAEILTRIVFPKGYLGYKRWFAVEGTADEAVKLNFRKNYRRYNQRLLQGFGTISMVSNLSVFVVAALLGHLEWAFIAIGIGFNAIFVALVVLQRLSLKKQLALAASDNVQE